MSEVWRKLAAGLAVLVLLLAWQSWLTPSRVLYDAENNLRMGYNLAHHGVVSIDGSQSPRPDMYREPLPALANAATLLIIETFAGPAPAQTYLDGPRTRWMKYQNLVWLSLITLSVLLATRLLTRNFWTPWAAVLLLMAPVFLLRSELVDGLGSDLSGAALLAASSGLLAAAWKSGDKRLFMAAGAAFGLLVLIKATVLYVVIGLTAFLIGLLAWRARGWPERRHLIGIALLCLTCSVVVFPWMVRNQVRFGSFDVANRGGQVLLLRAYENMATSQEYRGAFYAYAMERLKPATGALLGFGPRDLAENGRLERLGRGRITDQAGLRAAALTGEPAPGYSFYWTNAERMIVLRERAAAAGATDPLSLADAEAKQEAIRLILKHPWRHLAMTLPILWRGGAFITLWLLAAMLLAMRRSRDDLAVFLLPAVGLGAFLALFSHFIPRYAWPMIPIVAVLAPSVAETLIRRGYPLAAKVMGQLAGSRRGPNAS